jgi:hypothetical protein
MGCGPARNAPCDHIFDVSSPTLTPFIVSNGTGASIVIAPGGGYHDLAWGKVCSANMQPHNHMTDQLFLLSAQSSQVNLSM